MLSASKDNIASRL